jgi:hypothetical protein
MAHPQVADGGEGLQTRRVAANVLNKLSRTADNGWPSSLGVGRGANNSPPTVKNTTLRNVTKGLGLGRTLWKMDTRFGTWNVSSLKRSLKTVSGKLAKYKLDLVGVQEVRWDKGSTEPAGDYIFFYGNWNADHHLGTGFFVHKRIILAVKKVEFASDGMSYNIERSLV